MVICKLQILLGAWGCWITRSVCFTVIIQTENVQKDGPMVKAVVKEVELRHHRLKELEACWPGTYAQIIVKHCDSVSADTRQVPRSLETSAQQHSFASCKLPNSKVQFRHGQEVCVAATCCNNVSIQ